VETTMTNCRKRTRSMPQVSGDGGHGAGAVRGDEARGRAARNWRWGSEEHVAGRGRGAAPASGLYHTGFRGRAGLLPPGRRGVGRGGTAGKGDPGPLPGRGEAGRVRLPLGRLEALLDDALHLLRRGLGGAVAEQFAELFADQPDADGVAAGRVVLVQVEQGVG